MSDLIFREFNGKQIRHRNSDGYICLTDMAKATGKFFKDWYRLKSTKDLLHVLSIKTGFSISEPESTVVETGEDSPSQQNHLITVSPHRIGLSEDAIGAYGHPKVAIAFATWCSPEFFSVVIDWTQEILTEGGTYNDSATLEQLEALQEKNLLMQQKLILEEAENRRVTQLNHEVSQIDAKLIFIIKLICEKLIQQAIPLGSLVLSQKREKAYWDYWQVLYALNQSIPEIFPSDYMHTKSMLDHSLTDEKVAKLFDAVALKGRDTTWEKQFKKFHDFNLSEN